MCLALGLQDEDHLSYRDIQRPSPLGPTPAALLICQTPPLLPRLITTNTLQPDASPASLFAQEYIFFSGMLLPPSAAGDPLPCLKS